MFAPPIISVSSGLPQPSPPVAGQSMEKKYLLPESTPSQLCFPNEFPYEFGSPTFSSPFTSTEDSTATEDETSDDEDDFFAGLTRRLALSTQRLPSPPSLAGDKPKVKPQVMAKSSESTPSGLVSPNGPFSQAPSPPTSPFREEEEDGSFKVLSAAAGEVAKMATKPTTRRRQITNPNSFTTFPQNAAFYNYLLCQPQNSSRYHQSPIRFDSTRRLPNVFIPQTRVDLCRQTALIASPYRVSAAANAVKQPSVGTGVFLPRNYPNPFDSQKKSGGGCVKSQTKQQSPKTKEISGRCQQHSQARLFKGRNKIDHVVAGGCLKK